MKKRFLAILLSITLLCGCTLNKEEIIHGLMPTPVTTQVSALCLSFNAAKTLDPYALTTALNTQLGKLLWEPLYALSDTMECLPVLADGYEKRDDISYRVRLNRQKTFWDGSPVTADDVLFSYQKALESPNFSHLKNSIAAMSKDGEDLTVTLTRPNIYFYGLLDFPIIKKSDYSTGSSDKQAENAVPPVPYVGTGLYIPTFNTNTITLTLNSRHSKAAEATVTTITLEDTPDFAAMNSAVSSQLSDGGYSDLTGGLKPSVSGNVFDVNQNNLVFLGFVQNGALSDVRLRKAISLALNRTMLNSFYGGYAQTAVTPFHPEFHVASGRSCSNFRNDPQSVSALLTQTGIPAALTLVYCSDNPISAELAAEIARQLGNFQIQVTTRGLPSTDYRSTVSKGNCDLYIGELRLSKDYSFTSLLSTAAASLGSPNLPAESTTKSAISSESAIQPSATSQKAVSALSISCTAVLRNALDAFLAGGNIDAFLDAFNEELPFLPLLYRSGMVAYAKKYDITPTAVFDHAFDGIEKTTITTYLPSADE